MHQPLPEHLLRRPFSVAEGLAAGMGHGRIRGNDLAKPFWGVRSGTDASTLTELTQAWMPRMPPQSFFSHATAAQLWQIPLPLQLETNLPLHVSSPSALRGPSSQGVVGHHLQIAGSDIRMLRGIPVTGLERTVFDLAAQLDDEALLAALDNIIWHKRVLGQRASAQSISAAFAKFKGRRGRARLRELMPLANGRSDAPPESAFRLRFLRARFPAALPNIEIVDRLGNFVALPDLQFVQFRMAFDYEGDGHRTDKAQWRKDLTRVRRIQDAGWHHTRISADDLVDPIELLTRTRRVLVERGWTG